MSAIGLGLAMKFARGAFTPTAAANLVEWQRSGLGLYQDTGTSTPVTADGDPVGDWVDATANGNNQTQTTTARPLYKQAVYASRDYLLFDGSNDFMSRTLTASLTGNFTIGLVFYAASNPAAAVCFADVAQAAANGLQLFLSTTGQVQVDNSGGPTSVITSGAGFADARAHSVIATRSGTTYTLYVDGASIGTSGGTAPTYTRLFLGSRAAGTNFYSRHLAEATLYSRAMPGGEAGSLAAYFRSKFGTP